MTCLKNLYITIIIILNSFLNNNSINLKLKIKIKKNIKTIFKL